jgi:carboxyl-terminal processing protease
MDWKSVSLALYGATAMCLGLPSHASSVDGIWRSRGYGTLLAIKGSSADVYDLNSLLCIKRKDSVPVSEHLFRDPHLSSDGSQLTTLAATAFTEIQYDRLGNLPSQCHSLSVAESEDPVYSFEAFLAWFEDEYAFSGRRGLDWREIRREFRAKVSSTTSSAQLLEIFSEIFRQIHDLHVALSSDHFYVNSGLPPLFDEWFKEHESSKSTVSLDKFAKDKARAYFRRAWDRYLDAGSRKDLSDNLILGKALNGKVGYLAILAESDFPGKEGLLAQQAEAARELDEAMSGLANAGALILDLRVNFGGDDGIGLLIDSRLTAEDRAGLAKCTRNGASFTATQHTLVRHALAAFTGPIIVLSSPYNVSAGENVLMTIKDFPQVLIVGDRSAGVFSDTLSKKLPNGWNLSISNEAFIAPDGTMYETIGVPPDVLIPFYPESVRSTGIDPILDKALHILASPNPTTVIAAAKRIVRGTPSPCP